MKITFIFILLFCISYLNDNLYSQTVSIKSIIIDNNTSLPLAYVNIYVLGTNKGIYSNESGIFTINIEEKDSLIISHLGYKNLKISTKKINDTIYLIPKIEELEEVILSDNKPIKKIIGNLKKASNFSWFLVPNQELATIVKPKSAFKNTYIDKIHIPLKKIKNLGKVFKGKNGLNNNKMAVFRVNIYTIKNNLPNTKIWSSSPIKFIKNKKEQINIDVSNLLIEFSEKGICIGVEMIGNIDSIGNILKSKKSFIAIKFTNKKSKDFISIPYYKLTFSDKTKWLSVNDIIKENSNSSKNYSLSIGLTVSEYDD